MGKLSVMSDDDFPSDHEDGHQGDDDHEDGGCGHGDEGCGCEGGSFYEEQYPFDQIERRNREIRSSGRLLILLAIPAAGLLALLR